MLQTCSLMQTTMIKKTENLKNNCDTLRAYFTAAILGLTGVLPVSYHNSQHQQTFTKNSQLLTK